RNQGGFGGGTAQPQANAAHNGASPSNAPQAQPQNGQQQESVAQPQAAYSREAQENEMMDDAREQGNLDRRSATEVPWNSSQKNLARASCSNAGKPALAVSDHGGFAAMKKREIGTLKF